MPKDSKEEFQDTAFEVQGDYKEQGSNYIPESYGLCSVCINLNYVSSEFKESAVCDFDKWMSNWPDSHRPILRCSRYSKRGQLSLLEMGNMATYIEVKKKVVGFSK